MNDQNEIRARNLISNNGVEILLEEITNLLSIFFE